MRSRGECHVLALRPLLDFRPPPYGLRRSFSRDGVAPLLPTCSHCVPPISFQLLTPPPRVILGDESLWAFPLKSQDSEWCERRWALSLQNQSSGTSLCAYMLPLRYQRGYWTHFTGVASTRFPSLFRYLCCRAQTSTWKARIQLSCRNVY